jgi:methyl-accepting chemotaxis protein
MANRVPYKRRQYLVDTAFQLHFVSRIFLVVLAVAVLSCLITFILLWKNMYVPEQESHLPLIASLIAVSTTLLVELLVAIPVVFIMGIRQSHRIVGPMNRLKQTLQAIGSGDFSQRITLREGDALEELARSINAMAEELQKRFPASA